MKLLGNYQNGNYFVSIFDDGTKIRRTKDDEFIPSFSENCDIKITNYCDIGCPMCHENSTTCGKHGNLNLDFINTLHPFTELAIGGGDPLSHPDLVPFLEKLKEKKVIANITVNQTTFEKRIDFLEELFERKLIYGLGVSLVNPSDSFIEKIKKFDSAVIHTINGILSESDINKLADNNLKMLILGFKDFRRGTDYLKKNTDIVKERQNFLYNNLESFVPRFKLVSFDNLAITQLNVKRFMTESEWEEFYMGDDGTMTFYIDCVEEKFGASSIATKRYDILPSIDEMFNVIRKEKA